MDDKGQVIIIVAFLLVAVLIVLALIIDGSRFMLEQQELDRAADAAGKAGMIIVGDQMVTQVAGVQTAAARITLAATSVGSSPGPTLTPTPAADEFFSWINEDHKKTLVAPPMQTLVAAHVLGSAEENGFGLSNPAVTGLEISYPNEYHPGDRSIQISVRINRLVVVMFGNLLNLNEGVISGKTKQSIP